MLVNDPTQTDHKACLPTWKESLSTIESLTGSNMEINGTDPCH